MYSAQTAPVHADKQQSARWKKCVQSLDQLTFLNATARSESAIESVVLPTLKDIRLLDPRFHLAIVVYGGGSKQVCESANDFTLVESTSLVEIQKLAEQCVELPMLSATDVERHSQTPSS